MNDGHEESAQNGGGDGDSEQQIGPGQTVPCEREYSHEYAVVDDAGSDGQTRCEQGACPIDGELPEAGKVRRDGQREGTRTGGQAREEVKSQAAEESPDDGFPCSSEQAPRNDSKQHEMKSRPS